MILRVSALATAVLALCAVVLSAGHRGSPSPKLQRYWNAPQFSLMERSGRVVGSRDLAGKVWIASFLFTRCTQGCPVLASRLKEIQESLPSDLPVQIVTFTADPNHDTPEVLARYARGIGASSERWLFLTGPLATLEELSYEGFRLGRLTQPDAHSLRFVLVDPHGVIRGFYQSDKIDEVRDLRRDLQALLREQ